MPRRDYWWMRPAGGRGVHWSVFLLKNRVFCGRLK